MPSQTLALCLGSSLSLIVGHWNGGIAAHQVSSYLGRDLLATCDQVAHVTEVLDVEVWREGT